ncbi:putative major royal jelly protein [Rosellinia necatrix]|uniref:Putative major royal jelly protein n=1 Tax=Rosellinia necatrix TaxID=77044 RepID=A0A1W2TMB5_ROSNE|nr:putative major royal jelly protein [Rosellinia necatrix]
MSDPMADALPLGGLSDAITATQAPPNTPEQPHDSERPYSPEQTGSPEPNAPDENNAPNEPLEGPNSEVDRSPPSYKSGGFRLFGGPRNSDRQGDEQRRIESLRSDVERAYTASLPWNQWDAEVDEEREHICEGLENRTRHVPADMDFHAIAEAIVKASWVHQRIWREEWENGWDMGCRWRHEDPPEPEPIVPPRKPCHGRFSNPRQTPEEIEERKRRQQARAEWKLRQNVRHASRPFARFIHQMDERRGWIEERSKADESPPLDRMEINTIAYQEVQARWKRRGIWDERWGIMPGMSWKHEFPLDEVMRVGLGADVAPHQNPPAPLTQPYIPQERGPLTPPARPGIGLGLIDAAINPRDGISNINSLVGFYGPSPRPPPYPLLQPAPQLVPQSVPRPLVRQPLQPIFQPWSEPPPRLSPRSPSWSSPPLTPRSSPQSSPHIWVQMSPELSLQPSLQPNLQSSPEPSPPPPSPPSPQPPQRVKRRPGRPARVSRKSDPDEPLWEPPREPTPPPRRSKRIREANENDNDDRAAGASDVARGPASAQQQQQQRAPAKRGRPAKRQRRT